MYKEILLIKFTQKWIIVARKIKFCIIKATKLQIDQGFDVFFWVNIVETQIGNQVHHYYSPSYNHPNQILTAWPPKPKPWFLIHIFLKFHIFKNVLPL